MKYMGSKNRIAKHILPIMLGEAKSRGLTTWVEPFVGGGNLIDKVPKSFRRVGLDANPHTVAALIAIRDMLEFLPDELTEEEYAALKGLPPDPVTSWLRFVGSFAGKFGGGYAREKGSNSCTFIGEGKRNAEKQSPDLQGVELVVTDYKNIYLENCVVYCDPPYEGATGYKTGAFNHADFWEWCRDTAERNLLFVSEYNAPEDFVCVWSGEQKTSFASGVTGATHTAVEKLFTYNSLL